MMISSVKAKKMLSKRCMAYLVYTVNRSDEVVLGMKDTPVEQKFLDVFFNNFLGLTPNKELEFSIKLVSDTITISKTQYKMTLTEL